MAGRTRQRSRTVIHHRADSEALRGVACAALLHRGNVIEVFAARDFAIVAPCALLGQAFEFTVAMTGFTRQQLVTPEQGKARRQMVKFTRGLNDSAKGRCARAREQRDKQTQPN